MNDSACNYDSEADFGDDSEYCIFPVQYYQDSDGDGTYDADDGKDDCCADCDESNDGNIDRLRAIWIPI